jgi:hypothetical protein
MVAWEVVETPEFAAWLSAQDSAAVSDIRAAVKALIMGGGPSVGRPLVDHVKGSRHANMKELRVQSLGRPLRVFFAFDETRAAVLLIAGDKTANDRFYAQLVPKADDLLDRRIKDLSEVTRSGKKSKGRKGKKTRGK